MLTSMNSSGVRLFRRESGETKQPIPSRGKRIPKSIRLLGYCIRIRQVTPGELKKIGKDDRPLDGLWVDEECTIYIDKNMPIYQKRNILFHELIHSLVDLKERD